MDIQNSTQSINTLTLSGGSPANNSSAQNKIAGEDSFWGEDGFTFDDVLDIINPLQHLPIVSNIYQSVTGDEQSNGSKIAGGALYGGFVGIIASFFDSTLEQETGKSSLAHAKEFGNTLLSSLSTDTQEADQLIALASSSQKSASTIAAQQAYQSGDTLQQATRQGLLNISS